MSIISSGVGWLRCLSLDWGQCEGLNTGMGEKLESPMPFLFPYTFNVPILGVFVGKEWNSQKWAKMDLAEWYGNRIFAALILTNNNMKQMAKKGSKLLLPPKGVPSLMTKLTKWYSDNFTLSVNASAFVSCFHTYGINDKSRAFILLVGKERWYRGCHCWFLQMRVHERNTILLILEKMKPWSSTKVYSDFEDIYNDVKGYLKVKYVSQIVIYDIAVRIAYLKGCPSLLPDKYVYLHAKPLLGYNTMIKNGLFPLLTASAVATKIDRSLFKSYFGGMSSIDIENLMCEIGKSCKRIRLGKTSTNPVEQDLDEILRPYIIIF